MTTSLQQSQLKRGNILKQIKVEGGREKEKEVIVHHKIVSSKWKKWNYGNFCSSPRQRGASRKGDFFYIVPLDPTYPAKAGRGTCRSRDWNKNYSV